MTVSIANHLAADAARTALRADVRQGLAQHPKSLPPKWFYDDVGSELFDQITRLPEYYPTRAEAEILRAHSGEVAALSGADTLVELGSGTSEKTRMLLDALQDAGTLRRFIPWTPGCWRRRGRRLPVTIPACEWTESAATSSTIWRRSPTVADDCSCFWDRPSAT